MKFSSYREIVDNYVFLAEMVKKMEDEDFLYRTTEEIQKEKTEIIEDLRTDTAFKLFTKFEAGLRIDYERTLKSKWKDALSKRYRLLCTELRRRNKLYDKPIETSGKRVRFEDIVETIKNHFKEIDSVIHKECSQIKEHIQFRNWYAHGRYFSHSPAIPDPEDLEMTFSVVEDVVIDR